MYMRVLIKKKSQDRKFKGPLAMVPGFETALSRYGSLVALPKKGHDLDLEFKLFCNAILAFLNWRFPY